MTYLGGEGDSPKKTCPACGKLVSAIHANAPDRFCQREKDASVRVYRLHLPGSSIHSTRPVDAVLKSDYDAMAERQDARIRAEINAEITEALRDVYAGVRGKVEHHLEHAEGCDEGWTQRICKRCDLLADLSVTFGGAYRTPKEARRG